VMPSSSTVTIVFPASGEAGLSGFVKGFLSEAYASSTGCTESQVAGTRSWLGGK